MANSNTQNLGDLTFDPVNSPIDPTLMGQMPSDAPLASDDAGDYTADSPFAFLGGDISDDGSDLGDGGDFGDDALDMGDDGSEDDGDDPSDADIAQAMAALFAVPQDTTVSHPKHGSVRLKKGTYRVHHKKAAVKRAKRVKSAARKNRKSKAHRSTASARR